jgi:hypothetical protein
MKTFVFTFDVNGGHDIKTGILQTQSNIPDIDEHDIYNKIISDIVMRCVERFVFVNEKNFRILGEPFWNSICCFLKTKTQNQKLNVNILSLYEINDQKDFNRKLTDKNNKYDIFINCCNPDPLDDYFIYENQKVIFYNVNEYATSKIHPA